MLCHVCCNAIAIHFKRAFDMIQTRFKRSCVIIIMHVNVHARAHATRDATHIKNTHNFTTRKRARAHVRKLYVQMSADMATKRIVSRDDATKTFIITCNTQTAKNDVFDVCQTHD